MDTFIHFSGIYGCTLTCINTVNFMEFPLRVAGRGNVSPPPPPQQKSKMYIYYIDSRHLLGIMYNHLNLLVYQSRAIQCFFACIFARVHAHGYGHACVRLRACLHVCMCAPTCMRAVMLACVREWVRALDCLSPCVIARVLVMRACELLSCMYGRCVLFIEYV